MYFSYASSFDQCIQYDINACVCMCVCVRVGKWYVCICVCVHVYIFDPLSKNQPSLHLVVFCGILKNNVLNYSVTKT